MSEGEVETLRRAIDELSRKSDRQHEQNQRAQAADREAFAKAMSDQRQLFQEALNKQFLEHVQLEKKVEHGITLMSLCVGEGQPGEGRLGKLEETVEMLKKFRWQALALLTGILWAADKFAPMWKH